MFNCPLKAETIIVKIAINPESIKIEPIIIMFLLFIFIEFNFILKHLTAKFSRTIFPDFFGAGAVAINLKMSGPSQYFVGQYF